MAQNFGAGNRMVSPIQKGEILYLAQRHASGQVIFFEETYGAGGFDLNIGVNARKQKELCSRSLNGRLSKVFEKVCRGYLTLM